MPGDVVEVKQYIKNLTEGSTIPDMLMKILRLVQDESSSSMDLSRLISYDQALTESILRVANSAMFGHSGRIKDIDQAVMFLGYRQIKSIALGMTVIKMFPPGTSFSLKNLWIHGYEVACISHALSETVPTTSAKEGFLSGLLHDIGRVIFLRIDQERFLKIGTGDDLLARERELFGCSHVEAGMWYLEHTGLPEEIIIPIQFHHSPFDAHDYQDSAAILSFAEALSKILNPELENDGFWRPEHDEINRRFSLSQDDILQIGSRLALMKREIGYFFR